MHSDTDAGETNREEPVCPKCRVTTMIEHKGRLWCPRCGMFSTPPPPDRDDYPLTFAEFQRHTTQTQGTNDRSAASVLKCSRCHGPTDVLSGVYDDGEGLCGGCISYYADRQ